MPPNFLDAVPLDFHDRVPANFFHVVPRFDLKNGEGDAFLFDKKLVEELCYDMFDFHEATYTSKAWEDLAKEATAFSPDSLAKAILSTDVIKYIGRSIKGEHEFKANLEVLTDKVYSLLEKGLDDSIPGWNEAKAAEFSKYIKSQKRASRKVKRTNKKELMQISSDLVQPVAITVNPLLGQPGTIPESVKKAV